MPYSRAHLAELGLTLWRARGADTSPAEAYEPVAEVPAGPARRSDFSRERGSDQRSGNSRLKSLLQVAASEPAAAPATVQPDAAEPPRVDDAAREQRILAMDWETLEAYVKAQSRGAARQAVFGVGARDAPLMVVGEAPGAEEDERGEPFVGRAGQLLDQMLRAIGLSRRESAYIANICKFRPPNNRDPLPEEVAEDMPYLRRQIQLVAPKVLLAVGRIAAQNLLQRSDPIGRMRGQEFVHADSGLPVIVTYHPAYLLRSPREKAKAWQDLKRVRALLTAAR